MRDAFLEATRLYWTTYRDSLGSAELLDGLEPRVVRQTLACLLARVSGRSPLEYLSVVERSRQRLAVLANVSDPPVTVDDLVDRFSQQL